MVELLFDGYGARLRGYKPPTQYATTATSLAYTALTENTYFVFYFKVVKSNFIQRGANINRIGLRNTLADRKHIQNVNRPHKGEKNAKVIMIDRQIII